MQREERAAAAQSPEPQPSEEPAREDLLLMRLAPGERFFKFYILSQASKTPGARVEHRIITKEHADGTLEMVSYNAWYVDGHSEKRDVIRVPSLTREVLDRLVERVAASNQGPGASFREIDLSQCATVTDQLAQLAKLGLNH